MLVNMRDLLADARVGGYAVGSFSVANMEMVLGVLQAAEELRAPVILQIAEVRLRQSPLRQGRPVDILHRHRRRAPGLTRFTMQFVAAPALLSTATATFDANFAARLHWSATGTP